MKIDYHCAQCGISNTGSTGVELRFIKGLTWKGKPCVLCDKHFKLISDHSLRGRTPIVVQPTP